MDFLTNPFTTALLFLYQYVGHNIVLTIVIFTVLIRLVTYPLNYQQMKSSKAMQELQPKLKKLQEKYKGDREKLAQEQMKMYNEYGVNPMAGCLPLLVQLPILFSLYPAIGRLLADTPLQLLDLYHRNLLPGLSYIIPLQNQFLWLNMAQPDPYYILPILVVATTWLQQKLMTPVTANADPTDTSAAMSRNMMVMMPLMFGFMSMSFAAGLSIYFIVSNLAGIVQYMAYGKSNIRNLLPARAAAGSALAEAPDDEPDEVVESAPKKKSITSVKPSVKSSTPGVIEPTRKRKTGTTKSAAPDKPKTSRAK